MARPILLTTLVFALAGCGGTGTAHQEPAARRADEHAAAVEKALVELKGAIERLTTEGKGAEQKEAATAKATADRLGAIEQGGTEEGERAGGSGADQELRKAKLSEAEELIKKLGDKPSASGLADAIAAMDEWLINPSEEELFRKFKLDQLGRLRQLVNAEVVAHQEAALRVPSGAAGAKEHAEAGRILTMFPMSDEASVIEEAKQLASRQAEIVSRLEVVRRQRYNRWATEQIEKALDFYNANVSKWNPLNDNAILIGALVENLGELDPVALEPAVLELYNYVVERTKGSISEKNKLELAKRLTDPSIRRKLMGDF
jgi:hypothetical protein